MKKYITYAMTALFATIAVSIAAPDKDAMMAKEKAAWQAFKDKKNDEFKKLLSADFMGVYSDGIQTLQKELDTMKKWDMKSFSFSDFNVVFPDADTATMTYKVTVEGTSEGKDASGTYNAGSVWRKHNGQWHAVFHTNAKEEKPASQ
jgi:hypothetical protein